MAETFRFSSRPNRAHEVRWRTWGADAFEEAAREDRPLLLNLTAFWCHWCHVMDETTYSEPDLIRLLNEELVPLRVDADQHPHVQDRYIAGGWPTNAFLTPSGEVLWAGTYVEPDEFRQVARGVLAAWRGRRDELQVEIVRRHESSLLGREMPLSPHGHVGLLRLILDRPAGIVPKFRQFSFASTLDDSLKRRSRVIEHVEKPLHVGRISAFSHVLHQRPPILILCEVTIHLNRTRSCFES
jgi:hypothetical protein